MPLDKSGTKAAFGMNVSELMHANHPQNQLLAIAYRLQRGKASGGEVAAPFPMANRQAHVGMIHSPVAGRTDKLPMGVKPNSYVIPSDVVSGIGQGNSMAGAHALNQMFKSGPYGAAMPGVAKGAKSIRQKFADGGDVGEPVDIVAAGGEYVVPPEVVAAIGKGDMDHGHTILDGMVKHIRKKTIKQLRKLPKPKAS